jgi:hypothetical protein
MCASIQQVVGFTSRWMQTDKGIEWMIQYSCLFYWKVPFNSRGTAERFEQLGLLSPE